MNLTYRFIILFNNHDHQTNCREDEKQPLSTSPTNSIKKQPSSVDYDGHVVHSRSGEILGKNSAV